MAKLTLNNTGSYSNAVSVKLAPAECFLAICTITIMKGWTTGSENNSVKNATKSNAIINTLALCPSLAIPLHIQLRQHPVAQSRLWYLAKKKKKK